MALEPDREQIDFFIKGMFRHASPNTFFSTRAFHEDTQKPFGCFGVKLSGGLDFIVKTAFEHALRAANYPSPIVYCTPIATFANKEHAAEKDLAEGLALSVECDRDPVEAGNKLMAILGNPTFAVLSGGIWIDPETGEVHNRRHYHWRLDTPARGPALARLKHARELATRYTGGDVSNISIVHPLRVAGSWHRKDEPILCKIEFKALKREINLEKAIAALEQVCPELPVKPNGKAYAGTSTDWTSLIQDIITGNAYHVSLLTLSAKKVAAGMNPGAVVNELRALMDLSAGPRDERWRARYNDIPRLVQDAEKFRPAVNGHVIDADYQVVEPIIAGLLEHAKSSQEAECAEEATKVAAETKPDPEPAKDKVEQLTYVPGLIGEITDWIEATAVRPNRIIALGAAVTVIGTLIGRRIATPTRSATHLYMAIIADSGAGKQHPMDCIRRLISAAGAACHVKGPSRLYSLPAVEDLLIANPLCLFMIDELGAFLQSVTNPRAISNVAGISDMMRTLWNASFSTVETGFRKGKPGEIIRCPALTTIGMTTKEEFLTALQGASVNNGFMNRHTVLKADIPLVRRSKPLADPAAIPPEMTLKLAQLYGWENSGLSISNAAADFPPLIIPWGAGAASIWDEIESSAIAYQNDNPEEAIYFRRVAEMGLRLATIRAVGCGLQKAQVEPEDLRWGAEIAWNACQYMAGAMQDHVPQTQRGEMAEKILGFIQRKGPVTPRRI